MVNLEYAMDAPSVLNMSSFPKFLATQGEKQFNCGVIA